MFLNISFMMVPGTAPETPRMIYAFDLIRQSQNGSMLSVLQPGLLSSVDCDKIQFESEGSGDSEHALSMY